MKKGFTKLEIILGGIILFFAIGFLITKNLSSFVGKENLLRQRFNVFKSLTDGKEFSKAYSYLSSSVKKETSLENYLEEGKKLSEVTEKGTIIKKIVINGDIGYVHRITTRCVDKSCDKTYKLEAYRKWIFENGNWYNDGVAPACIREGMYDMPPEFVRALSLLNQRYSKKFPDSDYSIYKCLDVQYADLDNAEGLFSFDENNSSLDRLTIYVDKSYLVRDDLLTAFLLAHEVNHANNYLVGLDRGGAYPCYELESAAFMTQFWFLSSFNQEEIDSVVGRIATTDYRSNPQLSLIKIFADFAGNAGRICGNVVGDCKANQIEKQVINMVKSNPYYQKQCGQN